MHAVAMKLSVLWRMARNNGYFADDLFFRVPRAGWPKKRADNLNAHLLRQVTEQHRRICIEPSAYSVPETRLRSAQFHPERPILSGAREKVDLVPAHDDSDIGPRLA